MLGDPNPSVCLNPERRLGPYFWGGVRGGITSGSWDSGGGKVFCWLWSRPNKGWYPGLCCGRGVTGWCHPRNPAALSASHWLGEGDPETGALQLPPLPTVSGRLSSLGSLQKSFSSVHLITPNTSRHAYGNPQTPRPDLQSVSSPDPFATLRSVAHEPRGLIPDP